MSKDVFKENTNDEDIADQVNKCSLNEYNTKKIETFMDDNNFLKFLLVGFDGVV